MNFKKVVAPIVAVFILASCASSYKPIMPQRLVDPSLAQAQGVEMLYEYNSLKRSGNKKLAKKEIRRGVKVVALEVTNNTDRELNFTEDIELYSGTRRLTPLAPEIIGKEIRQVSGLYMLWGLFWVFLSNCENNDCNVTPLPIGLVIGLINMGVARSSNKNFMLDVRRYNMIDRVIAPGQTVVGVVGIWLAGEDELEIRVK